MPTEIKMPQLGESVTEGTLGRWLKQPGERVAKYEPLLEVITDKVDTEVPAPAEGILTQIIVSEGETVRVGTVLAVLDGEQEAEGRKQEAEGRRQKIEDRRQETEGGRQKAEGRRQEAEGGSQEVAQPHITPVVARLLAEHGLDVRQIQGTGMGGRVSKQDVLLYVERQAAVESVRVAQHAEPPQASDQAAIEEEIAPPPDTLPIKAPASAPLPIDAELVPLTPMRRAIAEHMVRSVRTAPHVTTVMEVDVSRITALREQQRADFERQGVRLTFSPFFAQAAVAALRAVPVINGSFTEEGIVMHRRVHLGMAVALEDGLLVPVVRNADEKNLLGLARTISDLAERARTRRLRPDETEGGTFTITNHGVSGSLFATPIINQPQAAILGIGAIQKRVVVISHESGDAIAIRPMCYCSLTFDHRVCDGAMADRFLMTFKRAIEVGDA